MSVKRCTRCDVERELGDFTRDSGRPDGLAQWCRECWKSYRQQAQIRKKSNEYMRKWAAGNRQKMQGYRLRHRYGLEPEEYAQLLEIQGGVCAICHRDPNDSKETLAVDHCHQAQVIRGLLCDRCNRGIGLLGDDPANLEAAAEYIRGNAS